MFLKIRIKVLSNLSRIVFLLPFFLIVFSLPAYAALDPEIVKQLNAETNEEKVASIKKIALLGTPEAAALLQAMADDALSFSGDTIIRMEGDRAINVATGQEIKPLPENIETLVTNNSTRRALNASLSLLKLFSPDREERIKAAKALEASADPLSMPILDQVLIKESDPEIKQIITLTRASIELKNPDPAKRLAAVKSLGESNHPDVKIKLTELTDPANEPDAGVQSAAKESLVSLENRLLVGESISRVFTGLSLGSVLLLAALGLAITYGVMGIINMAHGELLMVGAYATYVMQGIFRTHFPEYIDWYVLAAIPVAFFSAGLVGILLERTVIRWLYGRPLETLLTTWGLSLILIQSARVAFGPQNLEVANPIWLSGSIEAMSNVVLPLNRIIIIGFAFFVLALMWVLLNRTRLGLFVRAVTQNRAMAGCVGVPTARIDTVAFGLGSAIAGLGGVALSQIANVGPDMGQGYIVDAFMTVVLGGVGQLAGAVWAAMGLGIVTKLIEGVAGAVIAKIVVLAIIIAIIQKRPQGLFAIKGRFVD
ncbi:MAG: urea ABC transporter permease subunit UrtB [Nitrosomonadaceae bacterium]|nr:urea ABC transporter permease subunit UrtB [Nitrosomonadaceae bacterium]